MTDRVFDLARAALDARLDKAATAPLAVAFSGGGDSLALLLIAADWANKAGRRLIALTVDHRLQPHSASWARWCAERARALGVGHRILVWRGHKPRSGLPAAARAVRHRLIAEAAREAGARVVVFGHTLDDALETDLMASRGTAIGALSPWSPSPVWPDGRGQFLLRPLIGAGRAELRAWLRGRGETWLEDPANSDPRYARTRARFDLLAGAERAPRRSPEAPGCSLDGVATGPAGELTLPRAAGVRLLAAAICCASGGERPPAIARARQLRQRIDSGELKAATLNGARIAVGESHFVVARECRDQRARPALRLRLEPGETRLFDGRFEVDTQAEDLTITALAGHMSRLSRASRARCAPLHPIARAALPALIDPADQVTCPTLEPDPRVEIRPLVASRLVAACGMVHGEADIP